MTFIIIFFFENILFLIKHNMKNKLFTLRVENNNFFGVKKESK